MRRIETWFEQNTARPKKSVYQGQISTPLVCHTMPFISSVTPHIRPLIEHNTPFVRFGRFSRAQLGVTLVEMMITLTIFAILGAWALPNFRQTLLNHGTTTKANEFLTDLKFARSEALKRGMIVEVCIPTPAQTDCDYGGSWSGPTGRVIGVRNPALAVPLEVIRVREPLSGTRSLIEPTNGYTSIAFLNSGLAQFRKLGGAIETNRALTAVFGLCHDKNNDAIMDKEVGRDIRISPTGGAKVLSPATAC